MSLRTLSIRCLLAGCLLVALAGCSRDQKPASSSPPTDEAGQGAGDAPLPGEGEMCGGIAAIACPEGLVCEITATHPDASGVCVPGDGTDEPTTDCATVRCAGIECPEGEEAVYTGETCCSQVCQAVGTCTTVADCEGLPHIMCVGDWSCDQGRCSFVCDASPPP